jgi:hypothetical protein
MKENLFEIHVKIKRNGHRKCFYYNFIAKQETLTGCANYNK